MNIVIVAPHTRSVPSYEGWGGTQRGIYDLAIGLGDKGHTVYVIAPVGSNIDNENVNVLSPDVELAEINFMDFVFAEIDKLNSTNQIRLVNLRIQNEYLIEKLLDLQLPVVVSYHHQVSYLPELLRDSRITITVHSEAMKKHLAQYDKVVVVPYGIGIDHIPFFNKKDNGTPSELTAVNEMKQNNGEYILSLGRLDTRKATASVIKIAKLAGQPMIIAGKPVSVSEKGLWEQKEYFDSEIKPLIDNDRYVLFGEANEEQKYELMGHAKCFILASGMEKRFEETFGRVIAESLATGTPVLIYRNSGTASELIEDGKHGFLFDTIEEAVEKLELIGTISREECRRHALENLSDQKFIAESEQLFQRIISKAD